MAATSARKDPIQFLERHPREGLARMQLGYLYEMTGRRQEALNVYYAFQRLPPGDRNLPIVQQHMAELLAAPTP